MKLWGACVVLIHPSQSTEICQSHTWEKYRKLMFKLPIGWHLSELRFTTAMEEHRSTIIYFSCGGTTALHALSEIPSSFFCELCKEVAGSAGSEPHMVSSNQSFRAPTRVNRLSSCFVQPEWSRAQDRFTPTSTHCRSVLLLGPVRQSEGSGRRRRLDGSSSSRSTRTVFGRTAQ